VKPLSPRRLAILATALAAWCLLLFFRLVQVQVIRGPAYRARARQQQERTIAVEARRGAVLDRQGRELAVSVEAESVFAVPEKIVGAKAVAAALAQDLGLPVREVRGKLASDKPFVWIARKVGPDAAERVRAHRFAGVSLLPEARRYYPQGGLAANVLGYVGVDGGGLAGIEYAYDAVLRGRPGEMRVACDARRNQYALAPIPGREAREGSGVRLSIDRDLQFVAEKELAQAIAETGARDGSVVLMDPESGEVLAMASFPSFDPNRYGASPPSAWRNRAIADSYEPGSVFKVITGATAIENGIVRPTDLIDCGSGSIQVGNFLIHDAEHERFGVIPLSEVISRSSNVGIIRVGLRLGADRLYAGARAFGVGEMTGVDLPGESTGILREVSHWSVLSNAMISMGQEVAVTPIQLAVALAAIGNGGFRVRPRLLQARLEAGRVLPAEAPARERILTSTTVAQVDQILRQVVADGTGRKAAIQGYEVAGKTGTAQKAIGHGYARDRYVATFAGYAPAAQPRLVAVITIDEPQGKYFASEVAAPVFQRVMSRSLSILDVPPEGSTVPEPLLPPSLLARSAPVFVPGVVPASLRSGGDPTFSRMPDVTGFPLRRAVAELSRRGLTPRISGSGFVAAQEPHPGAFVSPGEVCELTLSTSSSP
jgi:cell division protein FtsI (penicillin-binding protein 3)